MRGVLGLLVTMTVLGFLAARPAYAATFTVNSTGDIGDATPDGVCDSNPTTAVTCTLREAIQEANAAAGADAIRFDIPDDVFGAGVKTIRPNSPLPTITGQVTIDGYTQDGASKNTETQPGKTNAVLRVELDGIDAGENADGLLIGANASNSVIKGLVINRFDRHGVLANSATTTGIKVEGNFIGTDPSGATDQGNGGNGVFFASGSDNTVGGASPEARNVISGNGANGVLLNFSSGTKVEGNLIGTNTDGSGALGNDARGITVNLNGDNNTVGGVTDSTANTIAFNAGDGVAILDSGGSSGNRILGNSIFSNVGQGIDLAVGGADDGPTANDPKDRDEGANNLQNFPVIDSATTSGGQTTIEGKLNSRPRKTFTIQLFSNPEGENEGKTFLGEVRVKTNKKGKASFAFPTALPVGENVVTATATNEKTGDTSEFSQAVAVS